MVRCQHGKEQYSCPICAARMSPDGMHVSTSGVTTAVVRAQPSVLSEAGIDALLARLEHLAAGNMNSAAGECITCIKQLRNERDEARQTCLDLQGIPR